MRIRGLVLLSMLTVLVSGLLGVQSAAAALPTRLPVFGVVKAGLTPNEAEGIAAAFNIPYALDRDNSFRFASDRLANVPMRVLDPNPKLPRDEGGMDTVQTGFDFAAIGKLQAMPGDAARQRAADGFAQANVKIPGPHVARAGHTLLKYRATGAKTVSKPIDTTVRYLFSLAGLPLNGPGAKVDVTFDTEGVVTELHYSAYQLTEGQVMPLIPTADALKECMRHYPARSRLSLGLQYYAPPLSQDVGTIFPEYVCMGTGPGGQVLTPALVPAVKHSAPVVAIAAEAQGRHVDGAAAVVGGTPPYNYAWQSLSTYLGPTASSGPEVSYDIRSRQVVATEFLWVTVTDANGLTGTARKSLALGGAGVAALSKAQAADSAASGTGVVPTSVGPVDVGGEFNVWDWQCVKDSAAGFQTVFNAKAIPIAFRWTGTNAWERDFRDTATKSGTDDTYVDNVDLAWYTGHGNPGMFTFDNSTQDDGSIVPSDARWGDRDLEWMQLESCNVLQFFDGANTPIWSRWSQVFDGLHLLNGFQTTASCVSVSLGTAGRFSFYLFPWSVGPVTLPQLKVRQAWAQMARDLEPSGKQYVSMGVFGAGGVTNYDDYFWGQGPVGPDIPKSQITGYWWLVGTV
jgi:hypothetical protein